MVFPQINNNYNYNPTNSLPTLQSRTEGPLIAPSFKSLGSLAVNAANTYFAPVNNNILGPVGGKDTIMDLTTTTGPRSDFPNFTFHGFSESFENELITQFNDHPLKEAFQDRPVIVLAQPDLFRLGPDGASQGSRWTYSKSQVNGEILPIPYSTDTSIIRIDADFINFLGEGRPVHGFRNKEGGFEALTLQRGILPAGYFLANPDHFNGLTIPMSDPLEEELVRFSNNFATDGKTALNVPLRDNMVLNHELHDDFIGPPQQYDLFPPLRSDVLNEEIRHMNVLDRNAPASNPGYFSGL